MEERAVGALFEYQLKENNSEWLQLAAKRTLEDLNWSNISRHSELMQADSVEYKYFVGCIMVAVFIIGLFENAAVLFVYTKTPKLKTINNTFLIGLSLCDTGQTLLNIPLVIVACFSRQWIFGHTGCQYIGFVTSFFGFTQITLLTVIAVERYFIIVHKIHVLSSSNTKAFVTILCCYIYGAGWALGPLLGWSEYTPVAEAISCSINWGVKTNVILSYVLTLFVCVWFLPLSVIIYGYLGIARAVRRETVNLNTFRVNRQKKKTTTEKHVAITVLLMIGAFVVSWTPYSVVALISIFGDLRDAPSGVYLAPAVFAKASIIWNPIIYIARHREFRSACKRMLSCLFITYNQVDRYSDKKSSDIVRHKVSYSPCEKNISQTLMEPTGVISLTNAKQCKLFEVKNGKPATSECTVIIQASSLFQEETDTLAPVLSWKKEEVESQYGIETWL